MRRLLLTVLLAATPSWAAAPAIEPGSYVTENSWGTLEIKPGRKGELRFDLNAMGGNGHTCGLEGTIRNGKASIRSDFSETACIVRFEKKGDGLEVSTPNADACRGWCGARAWFEGTYSRPPAQCRAQEMKATRKAFKKAYDRKSYAEARDTLAPLLEGCSKFLDTFDEYWIRNDLAITLHHLGDDAACLKTLEPLRALAASPDDEIGAGEPAYRESFLRVAKATRANLKLCGAK